MTAWEEARCSLGLGKLWMQSHTLRSLWLPGQISVAGIMLIERTMQIICVVHTEVQMSVEDTGDKHLGITQLGEKEVTG